MRSIKASVFLYAVVMTIVLAVVTPQNIIADMEIDGDWVIDEYDNVIEQDKIINVSGNLTIKDHGKLTLINVTLNISGNLWVRNYGNLVMNGVDLTLGEYEHIFIHDYAKITINKLSMTHYVYTYGHSECLIQNSTFRGLRSYVSSRNTIVDSNISHNLLFQETSTNILENVTGLYFISRDWSTNTIGNSSFITYGRFEDYSQSYIYNTEFQENILTHDNSIIHFVDSEMRALILDGNPVLYFEGSRSRVTTSMYVGYPSTYTTIKGSLNIPMNIWLVWNSGSMITRYYPLYLMNHSSNSPIEGALIEFKDKDTVIWSGITDENGFTEGIITYDSMNYKSTYEVYINGVKSFKKVNFLKSTPLYLTEQAPLFVWVDDDFFGSEDCTHFDIVSDGAEIIAETGTVFVYSGEYLDYVYIERGMNLIGESNRFVNIQGVYYKPVFEIDTTNHVTITGFNVTGFGGGLNDIGIYGHENSNTTIVNNRIEGPSYYGIKMDSGTLVHINFNYLLYDVTIGGYQPTGIYLYAPDFNSTITNNTILQYGAGILLGAGAVSLVEDNYVAQNYDYSPNAYEDRGAILLYQHGALSPAPMLIRNNMIGESDWGIVGESAWAIIENNELNNTDIGIAAAWTSNYTVRNNRINNTLMFGIELAHSSYIFVENNIITNTNTEGNASWGGFGIVALSGIGDFENNLIINCHPVGMKNYGAYVTVKNNIFIGNDYGYMSHYYDTIGINEFYSNDKAGIFLLGGKHGVDGNIFQNNGDGIRIMDSDENEVANNTIENNDCGIKIITSQDNLIYHNNFMDNTIQVSDTDPAVNSWYHPDILEGNYWSDYSGEDDGSGSGKHANASDGIGDTLIPHPDLDYDFYPLMEPFGLGYEIEDIIEDIEEMDLPNGTENSLISKLENALSPLENGQEKAAINLLEAFINQIEALRGTKLTNEQADILIAMAQWIIDNLLGE